MRIIGGGRPSAILRPDGPFGALAGASRKAAWRRTLARRLLAGTLVLVAVALVLTRPGPLGAAARAPSAASTPTGKGLLGTPAGDPAGGGGVGGESDGTEAGSGGAGSAYGMSAAPSAALDGSGVVTLGGLRGAAAVPEGMVGMSLPVLDPTMAARLRVGDVIDAYAVGGRSAVARAARVLDVIGVRDTRSGAPGTPEASGVTAAYVFVAVSPADAARIAAGQRADPAPSGFGLAVRGARVSDADSR